MSAYMTVHNTRTNDPREASNKSLRAHVARGDRAPEARGELERRAENGSPNAIRQLARLSPAQVARATHEAARVTGWVWDANDMMIFA